MAKQDYDTTLALVAGNIAAGMLGNPVYRHSDLNYISTEAMRCAALIVADAKSRQPTVEVGEAPEKEKTWNPKKSAVA